VVNDLYRMAGERLPEPGEPTWPRDQRLAEIFGEAHEALSRLLDVPLSKLLEESGA